MVFLTGAVDLGVHSILERTQIPGLILSFGGPSRLACLPVLECHREVTVHTFGAQVRGIVLHP